MVGSRERALREWIIENRQWAGGCCAAHCYNFPLSIVHFQFLGGAEAVTGRFFFTAVTLGRKVSEFL
jgi:hypothetical protein